MAASKRVTKTAAKTTTAPKKAPSKSTKKAPSKSTKPSLATISAQIESLAKQVKKLKKLLRQALEAKPRASKKNGVDHGVEVEDDGESGTPVDAAGFGDDLLKVVAELDRRGRHDGMVPIPELRDAFLERGWTRRTFDDRLLQAERDFIVDLKTADDPRLLAAPDLAIKERGRGHLQYVVVR